MFGKIKFKNILGFISKEILEQTWFFVILITLACFVIRIWQLAAIKDQIFDEVYFVEFAKNYLSGKTFFDIHPPLGKLILALGIKMFSGQFGWRIMPAIFGTLLIPLGYLAAKELMMTSAKTNIKSAKIAGLFAALILAFDGMLLVYSRVGLIDIFLVFFVLLAFYLFLKFANTDKTIFIFLTGIALGLAASIKYIGSLIFLVFIVIIIVKKIKILKNLWRFFIFLIIIPITIYLSFFVFNFPLNSQFLSEVYNWHKQTFNYNLNLTEGHPYASKWWGWFLLFRPIWLYFKDSNGKYIGVIGMGNPLAWWSSIVVVPLLVWGSIKKSKKCIIILSSFLIFWLFWAFFSRVLFMYHAIPSFVFLALGTSLWLEKFSREKYGKILVSVYFTVLIVLFIYFLPIWIGSPISSVDFYHRIWLKGWI